MSNEIKYPTERTYWLAYSDGVRHSGITEPDQVTTTGQPSFVHDADAEQFAADVDAAGVADFNPLPEIGEWVEQGGIYTHKGKTLACYQGHNRTNFDPFDTPALFGKAKAANALWVQPTGAQDAYAIGNRVTHDNPNDASAIWIYESAINANTTEPGRDGTFDRWWTPIEAA